DVTIAAIAANPPTSKRLENLRRTGELSVKRLILTRGPFTLWRAKPRDSSGFAFERCGGAASRRMYERSASSRSIIRVSRIGGWRRAGLSPSEHGRDIRKSQRQHRRRSAGR